MYSLKGRKIFVAGGHGMVGSAVARRLERENCEVIAVRRDTLDLTRQDQVERFLKDVRPDVVVMAAAKVGGILANETYPADFLYNNLIIESNLIEAAHQADVDRFLFLGSSCIYPKFADQPIVEEALLTGPLEPTNEWYAVAKIAGIKLAHAYRRQYGRDYISAMPTNLYGTGDNFDLSTSHVVPAIIRKVHEAKMRGDRAITVWGTGTPRREFLHADDCADALVFLLKTYSADLHINVGSGEDITILDLTRLICKIAGFTGAIEHDLTKPDGTPRKLMSADRLRALGWAPSIGLEEGLASTYKWFVDKVAA
jgi:GDP-L-fucose synthase